MVHGNPPYALAPITFRFAALAALAGRAPVGGPREVALATYVAVRLADDAVAERALPQSMRAERVVGARSWLASLALPSGVRQAIGKLVDASLADPAIMAGALRAVIAVTASYLDLGARSELTRLANAMETQALTR